MPYELEINWGAFIDDSKWQAVSSFAAIEMNGIADPVIHASKLGDQQIQFQLTEETKVLFLFNISSLPFNLAYNLPKKKVKVYTNIYWIRYRDVSNTEWSEPSDWVAITYVK